MGEPNLVGRADELSHVGELLDNSDRLPAAWIAVGEAGIGKTTLWLAATSRAADRGYRVLSSRPSEVETGYAFAGLTDLAAAAADEVSAALPPADSNPATEADPAWTPLLNVNHPEYPGAHGCGTTAVTKAMAAFFGTDKVGFAVESAVTGTARSYERFRDAAKEVYDARTWAGLHFRNSTMEGAWIGKKVARYVVANFFRPAGAYLAPAAGASRGAQERHRLASEKALSPGPFRVAGAGFEPATSGL